MINFLFRSIEGTITIKNFNIYDRWGAPVYSKGLPVINDKSTGWDGTKNGALLPIGIYLFSLEVVYADNSTEMKKGSVLLIY